MLPAESADGIHDPIHLPERHTMHPMVQSLKGCLHGIGVGIITFMVTGEKHLQDRVGIAVTVVGWVLCHMASQGIDIPIHSQHHLSSLPA